MRKLPLHIQIILGLIVGVLWAWLAIAMGEGWTQGTKDWIAPFGTIFINLLKLIAVPLVLFSIISGVASLSDMSRLGRLGGKTLGMYLVTTVLAVTVGLGLVNIIKPGEFLSDEQRTEYRKKYEAFVMTNEGVDYMDDMRLLGDDPANISKADTAKVEMDEKLEKGLEKAKKKQESEGPLQFVVDIVPSNFFLSLTNNGLMLQVIFFAIFFGLCLLMIPKDKSSPILALVDGFNEVFLKMVTIVMNAAPIFVFALMAGQLTSMAKTQGELADLLINLGGYMGVVTIGLGLMVFLFYPTVLHLLVRKRSFMDLFRAMKKAQLLAFSTSSSAATLPMTMECVNERMGVSKEVTSFVLPVGATVNMDGTSLYQAIAVIYLAQIHMVDLDFAQQAIIILTATLASIGSAAVPSAGLIMLIIVLQSVGLNPAWIAIIFPVDRILDMCRTVVNVTGDGTVATVIAASEKELGEMKV